METDYTKDCLAHTSTVVDYLARYAHRIAITNSRLLAVNDREITLRIKDYRDGNRLKTLCLSGEELVRRFLLHVLPRGLMRIRHFGFLANRSRNEKLARVRRALAAAVLVVTETASGETPAYPCARCDHQGRLYVIALLPPRPTLLCRRH